MFVGDVMKIKNVNIEGFAALAPMAGVADQAFRLLCKDFGCAYTVGEMVSAKAISLGDKKSEQLMKIASHEHPTAIQIFGNEPETMAEAAKYALKFNPDIIDINMGCPAPKIIKNHSGSYLMKQPELSSEIIRAVKEAVSVPITVKFRTGWDSNSINCVEFAKMAEYSGADAITIHGRTKEQMYAPPVDLKLIAAVKNSVSIPVIGNGDIFTPEDAKRMYTETGCDFVMIGRGAFGRPWLFSQINELFVTGSYSDDPSPEKRMEIMMHHAESICQFYGEKHGMCEIRKHALWYTKGLKGSAKLRNEFSVVKSFDELRLLAEKVISLK